MAFSSRLPNRLLLPLILAVVSLISWFGINGKSLTYDELVFLVSGEAVWRYSDYRLNPENGLIPSLIATLPLQIFSDPIQLDVNSQKQGVSERGSLALDWWFSPEADHVKRLHLARFTMLSVNLFGIFLVFWLSKRLWGNSGGWLSMLLVGLSPNVLGHMPLVTADFMGAWTLVLAVVCYALVLEKVTPSRIILSGLTAGTALLSKHSGLVIGPVAVCILIMRVVESRPVRLQFRDTEKLATRPSGKFTCLTLASIAAAFISFAVIWTVFGWRYSAASPETGLFIEFPKNWELISDNLISPVIKQISDWKLIPEAYLYGIDHIFHYSDRGSYLNGIWHPEGVRLYHLWTFLYKTPLATLLLYFLGFGCLLYYLKQNNLEVPFLLKAIIVLGIFYAIMILGSSLGIGHRHAFTVLYISAITSGSITRVLLKKRHLQVFGLVVLSAYLVCISTINNERLIAYANLIGGGADKAYRYMLDSSLDWGQDLPETVRRIRSYLNESKEKDVYLAYFGSASPLAYGLPKKVHFLNGGYGWRRITFVPVLQSGRYVVSATYMIPVTEGWPLEYEINYSRLKTQAVPVYEQLRSSNALETRVAEQILTKEQMKILQRFEKARFHRLVSLLWTIEPTEVINGSVLVFDLSDEDMMPFR
jgi:hypothetical protein